MISSCWSERQPDRKGQPPPRQFGVMAILAETPLERRINVDVGRIH